MNRRSLFVCTWALLISSCDALGTVTPPVGPSPTPVATPTPTFPPGTIVVADNLSLTIPAGLANDAQVEMAPAQTDPNAVPPWELAPAHLKITFTGYVLQGTFHQPQIFVYPADEYAKVSPYAGEQIERLKQILAGSLPPLLETLPSVPFFNAFPQIASRIETITFQSGGGIRAITQYDQGPSPINNRMLFYHFQGLSDDGNTYIVAVLPIRAPILAEDENPDSPVPAGGVALPTDLQPKDVYFSAVTQNLNSVSPEEFTPPLTTLDSLIQSILVTTP